MHNFQVLFFALITIPLMAEDSGLVFSEPINSKRILESSPTGDKNCLAGCLICSEIDICLLCDVSKFYLSNGFQCLKKQIENCAITSTGTTCVACEKNFYLDGETGKCVAVTKEIANCDIYLSATTCGKCGKDGEYFSVEEGVCKASSNYIENCVWYKADSQCHYCSTGKLRDDLAACVKNPVWSNCEFYSEYLSCYMCNTGYGLEKNKYIYDSKISDVKAKEFFKNNTTNMNTYNWFMVKKDDVCLKQVTNCEKFNYFNDCSRCKDGYFKGSNGGCIINPLETIPFCLKYSNATTCIVCSQKYYLNSNKCLAQEVIAECLEYSITEQGVCSLCKEEFYFNSSTKLCKKRDNNIKYCSEYESASDTCKVCSEGYILSDGNTKCSDAISKCESYYFLPSPDGGSRSVCQNCLDGFYLKTQISGVDIITSCELPSPSILGCIKYGSNDTCLKCVGGFYLANSKCHRHNSQITEKLSCVDYSVIRLNECETCSFEHYLYTLYNYCENLTTEELITNCEIYDSNKNCYRCKNEYYVTTSIDPKTGDTIYKCQNSIKEFCTEIDRTTATCKNCNKSLKKIPNNSSDSNYCTDLPDFQKNRCTDYTLDSVELFPICQDCEIPYYPITWSDLNFGFCALPEQISDLYYGYNENNTLFTNCEILDLKNSKRCRRCDQNQANKYINFQSKSCVSSCEDDEVIETFGYEEGILAPVSYMSCKTKLLVPVIGEVENCYRVDYSSSTSGLGNYFQAMSPVCLECKTGFIGVINASIESYYSIYDYLPMQSVSTATVDVQAKSFWNPRNKQSAYFDCINFSDHATYTTKYFVGTVTAENNPITANTAITINDASYNDPTASFIENCATVIENDLRYGCNTCKWGYAGVLALDNDSDLNFVAACVEIDDCDVNTYYGGIGNHDKNAIINTQITCHKCSTEGNIPTFSPNLIYDVALSSEKQFYTVSCKSAGNPNDLQSYIDEGVKFVDNCAVQEFVFGLPQWLAYSSEIPHPNPVCIACKPGYRATMGPTIKERTYTYISSCTAIENCDGMGDSIDPTKNFSFNMCDNCIDGFVFKYSSDEVGMTRFDECVATTDVNCLIGEENGKCYKCKPQYYLNIDGHCDLLENEGCEIFGNLNSFATSFEYLNNSPFGNGCLKCADGYVNARMPFSQTSCVKSSWENETQALISPRYYIKDCAKYYHDINFGVLCRECMTGFNHSTDDKKCIDSATVDKCLKYYNSDTNNYTCAKCEDYYYLKDNSCILGMISSCIEYNNQTTCVKCKENNIPTRAKNGQFTLCFDRTNSLASCVSIDMNEGFKGVISCTQCSNKSYPISFDLSIKTCARFYSISQCIDYDVQAKFQDSSFYCNECNPMFYAKQDIFPNICDQRSYYPIPNCLEYEKTSDKCKICIDNFYLSTDGLICEPNPIGMVGCVVFKSITECQTCDENHFQQNFVCKEVGTLINNCEIYETETICQRCKKEYNLISNKCSKVELENCIQVGYDGICESCATGYECEAVNLANCIEYETKNDCRVCEEGFYVSSGRCLAVVSISNCVINATRDTCTRCEAGFVLEADAKSCTAMTETEKGIYKNSLCLAYKRDNTCLQCGEKFYFNKTFDQCLACEASANCAYCDFQDPTKCLICESGYAMTSKQLCVNNSIFDEEVEVVEDIIPDIYIVDPNSVRRVLLIVFSLIMVLII